MPIYEYICAECGEPVEKLQKISDAPLTDCPACGQAALKRKISAAGFRLAGGGWYETDFKSDNRRNLSGDGEAKSGGAAKDSGAAGGEAAKPAAESKPKAAGGDKKASGGEKTAASGGAGAAGQAG